MFNKNKGTYCLRTPVEACSSNYENVTGYMDVLDLITTYQISSQLSVVEWQAA